MLVPLLVALVAQGPADAPSAAAVAPAPSEVAPDAPQAPEAPPVAPDAASVPPDAPPASVAAVAAVEKKRPVRIAVQRVSVTGDLSPRLEPLFTASLVTELRKLEGVSVIGMDEVRALLEIEAQNQEAGCDQDSCLNELADALGADLVVTAALAELDGAHLVSFRRLDARTSKSAGVDRRFDGGNGEELLSAIGPGVEELFPDVGLREGAARGVDKEVGNRLNPPPIAPWMTIATAAGAAAILAGGVGAGAVSGLITSSVQSRIDASVDAPADGKELTRDFDTAVTIAAVANVLYVVGGAGALAAGGMAFFTDWWGYGAE